MILSEFAGAAQSLNGSIIINPCMYRVCSIAVADSSGDTQMTADAIHQALTLNAEQRESNWNKLYAVSDYYVCKRTP